MTEKARDIVRRARKDLGDLSQEQFGKLLGYERKAIIRFENGARVPERVLLAISQLLQEHRKRKR